MSYYKRKLPHWQPAGAKYFITTRLKGSLPKSVTNRLKKRRQQLREKESRSEYIQRQIFNCFESLLDGNKTGPTWLFQEGVTEIVANSIHYRDGEVFDLYAYCIMSNHLHLV